MAGNIERRSRTATTRATSMRRPARHTTRCSASGGNGGEHGERANELMSENPGVKFFNNERGYVLCTITPKEWQSNFRVVPEVQKPNGPVHTRASFIVEAGRSGANRLS